MRDTFEDKQLIASNVGVGFRNYRSNCFFNATLQALFHVSSLVNCLLEDDNYHNNCVTCSLRCTLVQSRQSSRSTLPSNLYSLLKKKHVELFNGECQDAHHFLLSLLDSATVHHRDSSIASNFLSRIESTVACKECRNRSSQTTQYITIPVDITKTARIEDALKTFFEREHVDKYCDRCERSVTAIKQFQLTTAPSILCLQIKRFSNDSKLEAIVEIKHDLTILEGTIDKIYKLVAIICHIGSWHTGHYTTITCTNGQLYEFDDANVNPIPFSSIIRSKDAYVLFYELQNREDILSENRKASNAKCNKYMANDSSFDGWREEETINVDVDASDPRDANMNTNDPGGCRQSQSSDKSLSNTKCNMHMAHDSAHDSSEFDEVDIIDNYTVDANVKTRDSVYERQALNVNENSTNATKCNMHMANNYCGTDEWIQVEIIDGDACDDNTLDCLNNLKDKVGSHNLTQDSNQNESQISGRRIVDVQYLFDQLQRCTNITCKRCLKGKMTLTKESRKGLASTFTLSCSNCDGKKKLYSDPKKKNQSTLNEASALAIVSVGLGFYHLQEFCTILNIPCMSYKTYRRMDKKHQELWWSLAKKSQEDSLNEEIRLAKQCNEVDSAGNALIAVKADGSWHTRSYYGNYSSLAGCAAIIGVKTNKIIYMDVKNKYCHVCKTAQSYFTPPNYHECNANYDGPPSGMENAIIVEGFKYCETKGARFNKFIGDGDSNTYKNLRDLRLYKNPIVYIQKYDCLNHLDKNFGKKCIALCDSKKLDKSGRNLLTRKIGENISKGIRTAAKHWKETDLSEAEKCTNLEKDCMNAPLHCFGLHDNCASYFCKKSTTPEAREFVIALKNCGLYLAVLNLCQHYYANNAKSLLAGYENNDAERYNGLITKYTGENAVWEPVGDRTGYGCKGSWWLDGAGKRVFNALAGSYKGRTAQAEVQYNSEGRSISSFQAYKYNNPQPACIKLETSRKRKLLQNAIRNVIKPKKRKKDESRRNKKKHYGEGHEDLDYMPSQLEIAKANLLEQLNENRQGREAIQVQTKGQRFNSRWSEVRQHLLTSSYFGRILKSRSRKSYSKIVEDILYHNNQYSNSAKIVHQRLHEKNALKIVNDIFSSELIDTCGIFIDAEHSFLGASPFRLCGKDGLLMVQCPQKLFGKGVNDSINNKLLRFWRDVANELQVNTKSHWYYEIQGQLHISNKKFAYLVVYLGDTEYKIEKINRDNDFWNEKMKDKLIYFFMEPMLKELVNSREKRNMPQRQYDGATETFI